MNYPSKKLIITQILVIFVLPVVLIYFNIVSNSWRLLFLAIGALFIYSIIKYEKWTHEDLGLRHDNIKTSLPYYFGLTLFTIACLFLIDYLFEVGGEITRVYFFRTLLLFIPLAFFQQFAFTAFLIPRLKLLFKENIIAIILADAFLFMGIHIIYPNLTVVLPATFLGGALFVWLYVKHPNYLLISLSHSAINITAVLLGFFNIQ